MAGHSKWANIKHRKERADKAKGKLFSRITKEIISAVKQGGSDPKTNSKLRIAIQKAKDANLPSDNVERNIKKAATGDQADYFEMTYELYGYGGVGIILDVMTDNKNRIASEIRIATNKKGGTIAQPGSVAFNFDRKGIIQIPKDQMEEEKLFTLLEETGAEDFDTTDQGYLIITAPDKFMDVKNFIQNAGIAIEESGLEMIPKTQIDCDEETQKSNLALIDYLESIDDVDAVYHNMNIDQ